MNHSSSKEITLVGAGLVGSLAAIFLAKKGYNVRIFERRPDMRKQSVDRGRSINLALSTRGIHALHEVGLENEILKTAIPMFGRMMHSKQGELTFQRYGVDDSQYINSISRADLNKILMTAAENTGKVKIHFEKKITGYDVQNKQLFVSSSKNSSADASSSSVVDCPVVIGTDGSASAIRQALTNLPDAQYRCTETPLDYGYKELHIPPNTNATNLFRMEKNALHIWPRGQFMQIALPNFDGSYTVTLFLSHKAKPCFEQINSKEQLLNFYNEQFQDSLEHIENLTDTFFANPTGHMVTVKLSKWNYKGQALLLGDAAHAIVPFFGQGMNCGFEDCSVLNEILSEGLDIESAFEELTLQRKENADAIADMAVENFIEMRDKVADPQFLKEKEIEKLLMKKFPGTYISRYGLVTFSRVPYAQAKRAGLVQDQILNQLSKGIGSAADAIDFKLAEQLIEQKLKPVLARQPL